MDDFAAIGRFEPASLPEQTLMELLAADLEHVSSFHEPNGNFKDVSRWAGLKFQDEGGISCIDWGNILDYAFGCEIDCGPIYPGGSIDFRWIPPGVLKFSVSRMDLSGSLETSALPGSLLDLNVNENRLCGTFEMGTLPSAMQSVDISVNAFHGTLDVPAMPHSMMRFIADENAFSGSLELSRLPEALEELKLSNNRFEGSIDLSVLPEKLTKLSLRKNRIEQEILVISHVPSRRLSLDFKKFRSVVDSAGKRIGSDK